MIRSIRASALGAGLAILFSLLYAACLSRGAVSADEYFSIGMAYYEIGKYAEAEIWLNRARSVDKTMAASEYNLGRIAFETGRYQEAAEHFEKILDRDADNVMALRGAAYARIKNGDLLKAEKLYDRVLALVPESSDEGYNYALVLYALEKYQNCEEVLARYSYALEENNEALLLLARAQKAQDKPEAADSYAKWAVNNTASNPQALYEYAGVLENLSLYARALEQYRACLAALAQDTPKLTKAGVRFDIARLIMTVDPDNGEGETELNAAVEAGFKDTKVLEDLLLDARITESRKEAVRKALDRINTPEAAESEGDAQAGTEGSQE
ncbi:MAG: tetratricopeptide repeat protein [Treponema sp.]|jgi:tetratricopeptide (TPR) repeat protein|nr:tetratricopeptide repeat protein [Treponema sp.]